MIRTVPQALVAAAKSRGGYGFAGGIEDRFESFAAVLAAALAVGGALRARGLRPGEHVAILLVEPQAFLTTFLGVSAAGLVPMPLAHPLRTGTPLDAITPLARIGQARAIVTSAALAPLLEGLPSAIAGLRFVAAWESLTGPALDDVEHRAADDPALVQFTSGSTSRPKGVVLTHRNLAANVHAIGAASGLGFRADDISVGWLPLFHDMGLIGLALCPLYFGFTTILLPPAAFLKRPLEWLAALSRHRATLSFAPNFAYDMCVQRVKDADLHRLDLSAWRVAGCGAEPIQVATLRTFARKFAPAGFRETSFVPAYGLAEHTLAVTLSRREAGPRVDVVRAADLADRRRAAPCDADDPAAVCLVSCGPPLPGHEIRIMDDRGRMLGERAVGEILVAGPSVMLGYLGAAGTTKEVSRDGWLRTGDVGYMAGGELYLCGRRKEMIVINGRNHFPQDLEHVAGRVPGVRPGRVAAFGVTTAGASDRAVVVAEASGTVATGPLTAALRREILESTGVVVDDVLIVPSGSISRTTSGKVQRMRLRQRYVAGTLARIPARRPARSVRVLSSEASP